MSMDLPSMSWLCLSLSVSLCLSLSVCLCLCLCLSLSFSLSLSETACLFATYMLLPLDSLGVVIVIIGFNFVNVFIINNNHHPPFNFSSIHWGRIQNI